MFIKNNEDESEDPVFSWSETPDLSFDPNISFPGNIVVLDEGLFNLSEYNNIYKDDLDLLHSKFLRLFASNYLHFGEKEVKELSEAKDTIKKDKILSKCFAETMNRNLSTVSLGNEKDINNICAKGKIPLYKDLEKYICETCGSIFD